MWKQLTLRNIFKKCLKHLRTNAQQKLVCWKSFFTFFLIFISELHWLISNQNALSKILTLTHHFPTRYSHWRIQIYINFQFIYQPYCCQFSIQFTRLALLQSIQYSIHQTCSSFTLEKLAESSGPLVGITYWRGTQIFFTSDMVQETLRRSGSSTALGPDQLNICHLRNLGSLGIAYLTSLFNLSFRAADIPAIWKNAIVIFILKAGKAIHLGSSYRPISLLCPAAKVLKRLLLPSVQRHLPVADTQHGYHKQPFTSSAFLPLAHKVAQGFNQPKPPCRTVAQMVDFSKFPDAVNHDVLLNMIHLSTLENNMVRWISAYLRGQRAACRFCNYLLTFWALHCGMPQGSVIAPLLFIFMSQTIHSPLGNPFLCGRFHGRG